MKNIVKKLSPLLFIPALTSCSGSTIVISDKTVSFMSVMNLSSTSINYSCQKCDGEIIYQIVVKESHSLQIKTDITLDRGALTITVSDENDEEIYEEIIIDNAKYEIPLESYGKHKIKIINDDFKGSYKLNWANN